MEFFRSLLVIPAIPATLMTYLLYFASLYEFYRILEQEHPEILARVATQSLIRPGKVNIAYKVLSGQKNGRYLGQALGPRTVAAIPGLKRLLFVGVTFFLILLLALLTDPSVY